MTPAVPPFGIMVGGNISRLGSYLVRNPSLLEGTAMAGAGAVAPATTARAYLPNPRSQSLLEPGTTTGLEEASRIPGMALTLLAGEAAWPDLTAAQSALDGRRVYLAQGRGLGGGSSMNAMAWFHGHPADFDTW